MGQPLSLCHGEDVPCSNFTIADVECSDLQTVCGEHSRNFNYLDKILLP